MTKRRKVLLWGLGALLTASIVIGNLVKSREPQHKVEIEKVARRDLRALVSASGWIEPHRQVEVSAASPGKVIELAVDEGETVAAGQLLLRIDPVPFRGQVDRLRAAVAGARADHDAAVATLAEAEAERDRVVPLADRGLTSTTERDAALRGAERAAAQVKSALARRKQQDALLRTAEHDLDQVTIVAAMSGVITRLNIEEGETVVTGTMNNPGTVLLTIADLSIMEARIEVDETEVVDLALGQEAEVTVDAFPDTTLAGRVSEVGSSAIRGSGRAGETSADFEVVVRLDELLPGLRPGLSATADIVTARRTSALSVSIGALAYRDPEDEARREDRRSRRGKSGGKDTRGGEGEVEADGDEDQDDDAGADAGDGDRGDGDGDDGDRETYGLFVVGEERARFLQVTVGITGERHIEITGGVDEETEVVSGPFKILRELHSGERIKRSKRGSRSGDRERDRGR